MPVYKKVNKKFFKKWTPEMAYVLGFFSADGYITVNKRGGQFWCIQIIDKQLLKQIKFVIQSEHKIGEYERSGNESTIYRLQIGSKEMCNDLRCLGIYERKTKNLAVPNVPKKYMSDFVRGYFDGDGNVWVGYVHKERKKPLLAIRVDFTSCSALFLETLKQRLEYSNINRGVLSKTKSNCHRLRYSIHNSLRLYDFMYNQGVCISENLLLLRKKKVFEKYISMRS